jgi:hypothetical protein
MAFLAAIPALIGAAGAAVGGLSLTGMLGIAGSLVSAFGSIAAGNAQASAYKMQGMSALIEGNQRALEYRRQGNQVLQKILETQANVSARAAAGGIDPFSGSAGALSEYALAKGTDEFIWAQDNATMSILSGQANQAGYRSAASSARSMGLINAAGSVIGGFAKAASIGVPSTPASAATMSPYATNTGFASPMQRA